MRMATAQRQLCLDLIKLSWAGTRGSRESDCAILLEIEPDGGLLQTTVAIPCGSEITLNTGQRPVQGQVIGCEQDDYGYIVNFLILAGGADWYPEYVPPYLHSTGGSR